MNKFALGLVETYGYISAVEALDVALKSANVKLLGCEYVKGGIVTIKITGDVAAVKASVEAASIAAENLGNLITTHVIARVSDEVFKMVQKDFTIEQSEHQKSVEIIENQIEHSEITIDELQKMRVTDIRSLARKLGVTSMTKKEIKYGKKEELMKAILNHREGGANNGDNG